LPATHDRVIQIGSLSRLKRKIKRKHVNPAAIAHPEKCETPTQGNQSTGLISDPASIGKDARFKKSAAFLFVHS